MLSLGVEFLSFRLLSKKVKIKIHRTIILPVVLYGYETWSLTLTEECRLRLFENRVLRRIFGPKRDEETGDWSKLHNEELNDLYCSPNIVRVWRSMSREWAREETCAGLSRGNLMERGHWEDPSVDGRIMLRWIFRKWDVGYGLDRAGSG